MSTNYNSIIIHTYLNPGFSYESTNFRISFIFPELCLNGIFTCRNMSTSSPPMIIYM